MCCFYWFTQNICWSTQKINELFHSVCSFQCSRQFPRIFLKLFHTDLNLQFVRIQVSPDHSFCNCFISTGFLFFRKIENEKLIFKLKKYIGNITLNMKSDKQLSYSFSIWTDVLVPKLMIWWNISFYWNHFFIDDFPFFFQKWNNTTCEFCFLSQLFQQKHMISKITEKDLISNPHNWI